VARTFYVIGASGVGKDALLRYARARTAGHGRVVFAHRYITRPADAGGENHVALSPAEFADRRACGCFALCWEAHGLHYGVGREVLLWWAQGLDVVINGSRAALAAAREALPALVPVIVEASEAVVRRRLALRGRESAAGIDARFSRARLAVPDEPRVVRIRNDGALEDAGERLVALLQAEERACG
jgi:ribose 1,5-bisphosphokinase